MSQTKNKKPKHQGNIEQKEIYQQISKLGDSPSPLILPEILIRGILERRTNIGGESMKMIILFATSITPNLTIDHLVNLRASQICLHCP